MTAGTGISVTPSVVDTSIAVANTGVLSITAGTNITNTGTSQNPILNASGSTGVASVSAGTGITVTGTGTNPIVNNAGVITAGVGTGITNTGTSTNPIFANSGVISITAGTNITNTGTAANPILNSSASGGVATVTAGKNMFNTGTSTNPIISLGVTGVSPTSIGASTGSYVKLYNCTGIPTVSGSSRPVPMYFQGNNFSTNGPSPNTTASLLVTGPSGITIPVNWFLNNMDQFGLWGVGQFTKTSAGTVADNFKFMVNSTTIITYTFTPVASTSFNFEFSCYLSQVSSTSAVAFMKILQSNGSSFISAPVTIPTITMANAVVIDLQATTSNNLESILCNYWQSSFSAAT